jgi:hypothetical protein
MTARAITLSLCVVLIFFGRSALAQQANPDPYTDLSQYLLVGDQAIPQRALSSPPAANLTSIVRQVGQGDYVSADLNGIGVVTTQIQNGVGNSSNISVDGARNSVTTAQIGNSNTASIGIVGNGNSVNNLQVGVGLSYQLQVTGTSQPISVQQYGRK